LKKNPKHEFRNPKQFQMTELGSTKSETRNPKQIRMFKKRQNSKQLQFGFGVLDFLRFGVYLAAVCFEFRASDFGFRASNLFLFSLATFASLRETLFSL